MKSLRIIGLGIMAVVAATAGSGIRAENSRDKYAPLRAALAVKERTAIMEAEETLILSAKYDRFLKDPETEREDKPALREKLIQQEALCRKLRKQAARFRAAMVDLKSVPDEGELTLSALKDAHEGLGALGSKGTSAWEDLLAQRDVACAALEKGYAEDLAQATAAYERLDTAARANQYLLGAIDFRRNDSTDVEFHVSTRLPRVSSAVQLGFGLYGKPQDDNMKSQITLLALIGYSQFFWDYRSGVREQLSESELPADSRRNIFGVTDGGVLMSDAITVSCSNIYYLSDETKKKFNGRIKAIWGSEGSVAVSWWNQNSARSFYRACEALSTPTEQACVPNPQIFELLEVIDGLIEEQERAAEAIELIHSRFHQDLAEARDFGEKVKLSSTPFNAVLWAKDADQTITRFEAAYALLDKQLAASAKDDWNPDPMGMSASVQTLRTIRGRFHSVLEVKDELAVLLE